MAFVTQLDALEFTSLEFPYDRITNELEDSPPRLVDGQNVYVMLGGKLAKRPGTLEIGTNTSVNTRRVTRTWEVETLATPPLIFILASVYDSVISKYRMEYIRPDAATPAWTTLGALRDIHESVYPHEVVVSRGLAYIKGFPSATGDKLGSVVFDASTGTPIVRPWGLLPPTSPAAAVGAITRLSAAINAVTTTIPVVTDTGFPAVPFIIQVEFEQMQVTAGLPGVSWTATRGFNGTVAAIHDKDVPVLWRNWSASDHQVDVSLFWRYSYVKKSVTGQYSSRAPLQTNPDKLPSQTGPFFDLIPKLTITGDADTTNVPSLVVMRSEDGGGALYELRTYTNTGAGSITVEDKFLESGAAGGTFNDPTPDEVLNRGLRSPTEIGNNPPPTVTGTLVVGTDAVKRSTPVEPYSGRLWFAIDNILFFSGQEEILLGVPEECWDYSATGRFFRFPTQITNIKATNDALYVFTISGATYQVTGTNTATFNYRPLFDNVGAPYGQPAAITRFGGTIAMLTHDLRVVLIENDQYLTISDPLFTDLVDAANAGARFEIEYFGDLEKEWLVVAAHNDADTTLSKQWIYDIKLSEKNKRHFWSPPWKIRSTAMFSYRIAEGSSQRRLCFFVWDQTATTGRLVRIDPTGRTGTDPHPETGVATGYFVDSRTNLFRVPPGNHVNSLRQPASVPVAYDVRMDRMQFTGITEMPDQDPLVYYYWDDFGNDPIQTKPREEPARRAQSTGYRTMIFPIYTTGQRISVQIRKLASKDLMQILNLTVVFAPNSGT